MGIQHDSMPHQLRSVKAARGGGGGGQVKPLFVVKGPR